MSGTTTACNALKILKKAREILPGHWIKGKMAADQHGKVSGIANPGATCFCALGAIHRAALEVSPGVESWMERGAARREATALVAKALPSGAILRHIPTYNDTPSTTEPEILALFDRAISKLEGETQS